MYPYRWNAYVIRTEGLGVDGWIDLAARIPTAPSFYVCRSRHGTFTRGCLVAWLGGDQGWLVTTYLGNEPGIGRWPYGWPIDESILPSTGPP